MLSILVAIFIGINSVMAQDTKKIIQLKEQYKNSQPEQKANILRLISNEYENSNQQKQMEYAQQIIDMPDSLVDAALKSQMYELLATYYKSKISDDNKETNLPKSNSSINWFAISALVVSIIFLVGIVVVYLASAKKYNTRILDVEILAERVYKEKYEKIKSVESKLNEELLPLRKKLQTFEKEEVELKKTLKRQEEANYLKNVFLSNMSHEIRTSLNGIGGFATILETELALIADVNLYSYAQKIQQSGNKLETLLTNIIDISRIEANAVEKDIKEYDIGKIISFVEEANTFKANEKGIVFKTKTDKNSPMVLADDEKLKKVLNVLVDNALKYTRKGFVTLSSSYNEVGNSINIEIKDTGDGIQEDYAKLINEAFSSEQEHEKSYQGIGIGLKLCKKFIDMMDGSIAVTTKVGKGTSFTISLAASIAKPETQENPENKKPIVTLINAPEFGSLDIFIVEDDRMNRMVLEKMLKKSGNITTAVDGDDALKIIKKYQKKNKQYHIMLFDINLPAPWDGIRLMHEIKRVYPEYKSIPFVAQTAFAMAGDKDRFLEEGFDDYIAKPISKNELITLIEKQIGKFALKTA